MIRAAAKGLPIDLATTTVSQRELNLASSEITETAVWDESKWDQSKWGGVLPETIVVGETQVGRGVVGDTSDLFEEALRIISNGSFPKRGQRHQLNQKQRHQLRDAMVLVAHVRESRDILVSDDQKAFGKPGSGLRQQLECTCQTRIMNHEQFIALCDELRAGRDRPES
jgi:hypothetical protein